MQPTEILEEEHQVILKMITLTRSLAQRMEKADEQSLQDVIDFIRNFADKCHHAKEEKILFVEAEKYGVPKEGGPIGMMLLEHDQGRGYVRAMAEALTKIKAGEQAARKLYRENMLHFAELLETHINKENQILYPMINMHIPEGEQKIILQRFEKAEKEIGEGTHEKYHSLVEKLAAKHGGEMA